jgi:hypothetical protein
VTIGWRDRDPAFAHLTGRLRLWKQIAVDRIVTLREGSGQACPAAEVPRRPVVLFTALSLPKFSFCGRFVSGLGHRDLHEIELRRNPIALETRRHLMRPVNHSFITPFEAGFGLLPRTGRPFHRVATAPGHVAGNHSVTSRRTVG